MKKNIIYIGVALIVGLLGGFLLFGGDSADKAINNANDNHEHSEEIASNQMWTCSMHPQIMKQEPDDCPISGMELKRIKQYFRRAVPIKQII
jgi:Cu(I)/Ag(I) efflux system membrane fusion protein